MTDARLRLTIDRGNTAVKVALWDDFGNMLIADSAVGVSSAGEVASRIAQGILDKGERFHKAVYCSVVASERDTDLASLRHIAHSLIDLNAATPMPISINYDTPRTLGADRIAAAVGAHDIAKGKPVMVADIGTAVTYDFVDADGRYLGGNIAPGVEMRLEALHTFTSALPEVSVIGPVPLHGSDTLTAMRSGAVRGIAAELRYYRAAAGPDVAVVLTGGSAPLFTDSDLLDFKFIYEPFLVMKGLNRISHYNEKI